VENGEWRMENGEWKMENGNPKLATFGFWILDLGFHWLSNSNL
jgi:hypothetical protein